MRHDRLYLGERAKKHRDKILEGIVNGRLQPEVYVIIPSENGNNILDIYPSAVLLLPGLQKCPDQIIGVAVTYWEALEVARQIISDLYRDTGGFSVREWLEGEKHGKDGRL